MKNLKKVLAFVLSFALVFGMVVTAAVTRFPDVPEDATYAEAVEVLSALGIIVGDENGNFNPDSPITRAEMSKLLYAMVSTGSVGQAATSFNDVPAEHWASGYIQGAKQLGFIDGYDAYTFGPEDDVTYEQVLKLVLCAMGYRPAAEINGGYPTGYLMVAADIGLNKGVTNITGPEPAPRSVVASIIYNGLNLPIMKQTQYGSDAKYVKMDGSLEANYVFSTLLHKTYNAYKVEGKVMANSKTALKGSPEQKTGYVRFEITNTLKVSPADLGYFGADYPSVDRPLELPPVYAEGTGADELLGYESVAFIRAIDGTEFEIISIVPKANRNIKISISKAEQIYDDTRDSAVRELDKFSLTGEGGSKRIYSYWVDRSKDSRITVAEVSPEAYVIWNGEYKGRVNSLSNTELTPYINGRYNENNVVRPLIGKVDLVDVDYDGKIDIINSKSYKVGVVASVNVNTKRITFDERSSGLGAAIVLDEYEVPTLKEYTIKMKDGKPVELSEIQPNDVLNICTNDVSEPIFYDIIVTREPTEGTVSEIDLANGKYGIDGKLYGITPGISITLDVGSEGIFYLDMDGNIAAVDASYSAGKYAYLIKMGGTDFEDVQMKMLTEEGIQILMVSERIRINDVTKKLTEAYTKGDINTIFGGAIGFTKFPEADASQAVKLSDVAVADGYGGYEATDNLTPAILLHALTGESYDGKAAPVLNSNLLGAMTDNDDANAFIAYDTDVNGFLRTIDLPIYRPNDLTRFNFVEDRYSAFEPGDGVEWRADFGKFIGSTRMVSPNAKVFMIIGDNSDDYAVRDITALRDGGIYRPFLFGMTADGVSAVLLLSDEPILGTDSSVAVFDSASRGTYQDERVTNIYCYQDGAKLSNPLRVDPVGVQVTGGRTRLEDLRLGDTFVYTTDSKGYVTKIHVLFTPGFTAPPLDPSTDFTDYLYIDGLTGWEIYDMANARTGLESAIYFGYLTKRSSSGDAQTLTVLPGSGDYADAQIFTVPKDLPVITIRPAYPDIASKRIHVNYTAQDLETSWYTEETGTGNIIFDDPYTTPDGMRYVFIRTIGHEPVEIIYVDYHA